jgi:hypothetical protein
MGLARKRTFPHGVLALLAAACATSAPPAPAAGARPAVPGAPAAPRPAAEPRPIPPQLVLPVERARTIGRQLYVLDKVSAIATDTLLAAVPSPRGLAGYLPVQEGDGQGRAIGSFVVAFFTDEMPPRIAYEIRVKPDAQPTLQAFTPPKAGTPSFLQLVRARQAALASLPASSQPINPVVLPAAALGESGLLVYLLAGTTKPDTAVLGQHFRALVAPGSDSVQSMTPLSKSVIELATVAPGGHRTEALVVSHVVTDHPLETHVFASLLNHLPIYVGTRVGLWRVDGDDIVFLGDRTASEALAPAP